MSEQKTAAAKPVLVWDLPTRLFHWCLVLLIGVSWLTGEMGEMEWHMRSGIAILALVLFRLLWGFFGSTTARFSDFLASPVTAYRYARGLIAGKNEPYLGHNPLGGWMVMALLGLIFAQASTGLFANDDIFTEGPLYHLVTKSTSDWLTGIHKSLFDFLLAAAALHIAAAFFYLIVKKDNLILPMVHGRKQAIEAGAKPDLVLRGVVLGGVMLAVAAASVWALLAFA